MSRPRKTNVDHSLIASKWGDEISTMMTTIDRVAVVDLDVVVEDEEGVEAMTVEKKRVRRKTSLCSISSNRARNVSERVCLQKTGSFRF